MNLISRKRRSLAKYRQLFKNGWIPVTARYIGRKRDVVRTLQFRKGGWLLMRPGSDHVAQVWRELGAPTLDILKIDCEGSEYDIVEAMPDAMLNGTRFIVMETHPVAGRTVASIERPLTGLGFRVAPPVGPGPLLVARRD
jgi:hypothetical protein